MKRFLQKSIPKFYYLHKFFGKKAFALLDVGSGNHSASKTKRLFPACEYHGIDMDKHFNNDETDFEAMTAFYEMDLTLLQFEAIPDNYFDYIRIAHVIEHLHNGDAVIKGLVPKLKKDGFIYIEYPGIKSTKLPSMEGTLNFYDDPTHVRIYSVKEISGLLRDEQFKIISSGTRRSPAFLMAMPLNIAGHMIKRQKFQGPTFWDILGFAEFVLARKQ